MRTATLLKTEEAAMAENSDPQLRAFLSPGCPEVFHSVATPTAMWQPDPFDIDSIHIEAREMFTRLLARASRTPPAPSGSVLVLLGEAGSGKTHLMRAFRNHTHTGGNGYCGYMQMTTETSNYPRYILNNLIKSLEQPHTPESNRTGLTRLSSALLESVPYLTFEERENFREGEGDQAAIVDAYADKLKATDRFKSCDLYLLRVLLHLERNDTGVRSRALMWLRCLDMTPRDLAWICNTIPRTDDADPSNMLLDLATVIHAVHNAPLVLLVDQLEDIEKQSVPVERFRKVVDAITAITDQHSNIVVVLACLEDYFKSNEEKIHLSKKQRLINDPAPIRLRNNCTSDDIRAMVASRLAYLYEQAELEVAPGRDLYPFEEKHLAPLSGLSPRQVLLYLLQHHQRCMSAGRWLEPAGTINAVAPPPTNGLDPLWNDFVNTFNAIVPDYEPDFAKLLAQAVGLIAPELPEGNNYGRPQADNRFLELELQQPDGGISKTLVAVCNKGGQGRGLLNQLIEVEKRAGEHPVSIVRTVNFPKQGKAMEKIAGMLKNNGHSVVVQDSDWRRMQAFAAFREKYHKRAEFAAWQKEAKPLGELASIQKLLRLNSLRPASRTPAVAEEVPPTSPPIPEIVSPPTVPPVVPPIAEVTAPATTTLMLGDTLGVMPTPVNFEPLEFTRHAAFLGGSGSGKTTAALNLIEQLLAQGVPAVLLDRKGDLCRYADPAAWDRPLSHPARTEARQKLRDKLDIAVYTPGESNGRPLALPVVPPGFDQLAETDREKFAMYAANALGSMLNFKNGDADQGQKVILAKAIEMLASIPGSKISIGNLREMIADQDDTLMNMLGGGYPQPYFDKLAVRLNTLELGNRRLLEDGEQLEIEALLGSGTHHKPGRVRLSVINTRFIGGDAAIDFWVSQFLVAIARYCAKNPKPYLQAVFLFDEADKYLPATKKPATKEPMEDLLKRARSAGVGIFLGTQSPGDLDYKCKENLQTWFLGKITQPTAIEKLKPMLAAAKGNPADKLGGQPTGQFFLVRESGVVPMKSFESFLKTEQQSEAEILELARRTRG
jgi:GTPase SAR1 family protein